MVEQLQHFQQSVGPAGAFLIPLVVGFFGGAGLSALIQRRPAAPGTSEDNATVKPVQEVSDQMRLNWEKKDNRRAPRRAGSIAEVLVALPGETDFPQQALVLNRSVGGL